MPRSERPRRRRGTPQHVRDLQQMETPVAEPKGPNAFQRRVGTPLADAARATTAHGDAALSRMGVKTKTGALLIGGGAVALSRPRRKVEKYDLSEISKERFGGRAGSAKMSADAALVRLRRAGRGDGSNPVLSRARRVIDTKDDGGTLRKGYRSPGGKFVGRDSALQVFHPRKKTVAKTYAPTAPPAPNTRGRRLEGATR